MGRTKRFCRILTRPIFRTHFCNALTASRQIPPRLHRLDARPGLPAHVPDPLLRFLAETLRPPVGLFHVLAVGRNLPCPAVSLSGRHFVRSGHRTPAAEKSCAGSDRAHHHPPRRGNFWLRAIVPPAGVRPRLGMVSVDRPAARRHPQHDRPLDDADGRDVLVGGDDTVIWGFGKSKS
jgi:hypothetical protein